MRREEVSRVQTPGEALVILADDLTGAADCAARCGQAGLLPARIYLHGPPRPLPPGAVALTSDSRHLAAPAAAERVRALLAPLRGAGTITWYKKIDSTLRGHLGAELEAALAALGRSCALICPAFPAQGRGLSQGYLVGAAVTSAPVHLPSLLEEQAGRPVRLVALETVRAGPAAAAAQVGAARRAGIPFIVLDAVTDRDLQIIVAAVATVPDALLCGSAGLVGPLAAQLAQAPGPARDEARVAPPPAPHPYPLGLSGTVLVVGSGSPRAHEQLAYLRQQQVPVHEVGAGALPELPEGAGALALHLPAPGDAILDGPAARDAAAQLADAALAAIAQRRPATLVLCGGDTAIAVLEHLGIAVLTVLREVLPGMPLTWGADPRGDGRFVILKAGNHGDRAALAALLQAAERGV